MSTNRFGRAPHRVPAQRPCRAKGLAVVAAALLSSCASSGDRYVSLYAGRYTDNSLPEEIALFKPLSFEDATQVAVAVGQIVAKPSDNYRFEVEANAVQWFERQDHQEIAGLFMARWLSFPWDNVIDTSFGFGNGLSWATEKPALESFFHADTGATQLLYHIAMEFEFALPRSTDWATFVRVHHRSGVFGLFDDVNGGSNVLALGLRYRL